MPNSSDNVYTSYKEGKGDNPLIRYALFAAKHNNDQHAEWYYRNVLEPYLDDNEGTDIYSLLLGDPKRNTEAPNDLPLSKHYRNGAYVYNRDTWDIENAVTSEFICTPFKGEGHHHQDKGSFTLNYRGNLM